MSEYGKGDQGVIRESGPDYGNPEGWRWPRAGEKRCCKAEIAEMNPGKQSRYRCYHPSKRSAFSHGTPALRDVGKPLCLGTSLNPFEQSRTLNAVLLLPP